MQRVFHGTLATGAAYIVAAIAALVSAAPGLAGGFIETFGDDPVVAGRFVLRDGPQTASRFEYRAAEGMMRAHYDTGLPTARLVRTLGRTLTQADAFVCRATFTIQSQGFSADTEHIAQIAFGLLNVQTTGIDRVTGANGGAYDLVSFDYFPNITDFSGPSLGPTVINSNTGIGFPASIRFAFGPETSSDPIFGGIPADAQITNDTILKAEMRYDPVVHLLTLRVFRDGVALNINNVGKYYVLGGSDSDPTTIVTSLASSGFVVDALGILLWRDYSSPTSSVIADVDYDEMEVCWSSFGDFDGDCDVDQSDYALFEQCASGPGVPYAAGCGMRDVDGDGDVDQTDFARFQAMLTGA